MKYELTYSPDFVADVNKLLENTTLILASNSPRRAEILDMLGLKFSKLIPDVDEDIASSCTPAEFACKLALKKVQAVETNGDGIIISADTIVVRENKIIGKPADISEAEAMLKELSGVWHSVITAIAVRAKTGNIIRHGYRESMVKFMDLTDEQILTYIAGGEPFGKAGAYAIQGEGGDLVCAYSGDLDNIIGFPASLFFDLVAELKREV